MSTFTVKEVEKVKDMPDAKFGPAKVVRFTFEETDEQPEWFTKVSTPMPGAGSKIEGEIESSNFGPKWKPAGAQRGGDGQMTQARESRITRQHSQEMALRLCEVYGVKPDEETFRNYINWFQDDAYGKMRSGTNRFPMNSDVPFDDTDLPPTPPPAPPGVGIPETEGGSNIKQTDADLFK